MGFLRASRLFAPVSLGLLGSLFVSFLGTGCSGFYKGPSQEAEPPPKTSKYQYENYKPAKIHEVEEFSLASIGVNVPFSKAVTGEFSSALGGQPFSIPLAEFAMPYVADEDVFFPLSGEKEKQFYTEFPIEITYSLKVKGRQVSALVNFGLMDAVRKGATDAERAAVGVCNLGSQQIVHPGSKAKDGLMTFTVSLPIPGECLKGKSPERKMLFVALDPESAVRASGGDKERTIVFDPETLEKRQVCFKTGPSGACASSLVLAPSPGVNGRMSALAGDSTVAVLPLLDPMTASAVANSERSLLPFFKAKGEIVLEGVPEDVQKAKDFTARVSYALCPSTQSSALKCEAPEGWMPLNVLTSTLPKNAKREALFAEVTNFYPGRPQAFAASVYALGDTHALLSQNGPGAWSTHTKFMVRACLAVLNKGKAVAQKNLDSQIAGNPGTGDDCQVFPISMVEENAGDAGASLAVDSLDSVPDNADEGDSFFLNGAEHTEQALVWPRPLPIPRNSTKNVNEGAKALFGGTYGNEWGTRPISLRSELETFAEFNESEVRGNFAMSLGLKGYFNVTAFRVGLKSRGDMKNAKDNWVEPEIVLFNAKVFGFKVPAPSGIEYKFPIRDFVEKQKGNLKKKLSKNKAKKKKFKPKSDEVETVDDNAPVAILTKESCTSTSAPFSVITVSVRFCAEGGLFFDSGVRLGVFETPAAQKATYTGGDYLGKLAVFATPAVGMSAFVEASVDIFVIRGGVGGELVLIEIGFPIDFGVEGGYVAFKNWQYNPYDRPAIRVARSFNGAVNIDWMNGRLYVFVDRKSLNWCKAWFIRYPCGFSWSRLGDYTLASYQGGNLNVGVFQVSSGVQNFLPKFSGEYPPRPAPSPSPTPEPGPGALTLAASNPISPADAATGVGRLRVVQIAFSKAVDPDSLTSANFSVKQNGNTLPSTLSLSSNNTVVNITPATFWPSSATLTVNVAAGVEAADGGTLANAVQTSFNTLAQGTLLARYDFEDNASSSTNTNNGTGTNVSYDTDRVSGTKSASFNGTNSNVALGNFDFGDAFTVSVWVKLPVTIKPGINAIIANGISGLNTNGFKMFLNRFGTSDRRIITELGNGTAGLTYGTGENFVTTNEWKHFVFTLDKTGTNTEARIYYGGVQATASVIDPIGATFLKNFATSGQPTFIGMFPGNSWAYQGLMDDFQIYSGVVTPAEIPAPVLTP